MYGKGFWQTTFLDALNSRDLYCRKGLLPEKAR